MNKKDLKIRGIAALIKEKLSDMITASDDITPKRAHSRLINELNSIAICQLNSLEMLREVPQRSKLDVPRIQKRLYLNIN